MEMGLPCRVFVHLFDFGPSASAALRRDDQIHKEPGSDRYSRVDADAFVVIVMPRRFVKENFHRQGAIWFISSCGCPHIRT